MNDIVNQIAEALDEAEEPKKRKPSPMAIPSLQHGSTEYEDPESEMGGGTLDPGTMPFAPKRGGREFMARQLRKPPAKAEKALYDEKSYQENRRKVVGQVTKAVQGLSKEPDFKNLLHILRRHNVPGFEVLSYFDSEAQIRDLIKKEKSDVDPAERYVKLIYNNERLRTYTASSSVRKTTGGLHHPFRIQYERRVKDPETGSYFPPVRRLGQEIEEIVKQERKIQGKIQYIDQIGVFPNVARKKEPKLAKLSDEDIAKKLQNAKIELNQKIEALEADLEGPRAKYDALIAQLSGEYRSRIEKFKNTLLKVLPERMNQVLNKVYPQDYQDWLRTSHTTLGPTTNDDVEDDYQNLYSVEMNDGTVQLLPADQAQAIVKSGEGTIAKGTREEEEETPDLSAEPEKISSSLNFYTLSDYEEDSGGTLCKYCSSKGNPIYHAIYNEYGTWVSALSDSGYNPAEQVVYEYEQSDNIDQVVLRRHEIAERDLLNHPELVSAAVYPRDQREPKVYAIRRDTNKLIALTYDQYVNLYRQREAAQVSLKRGRTIDALPGGQKLAASMALPQSRQGEMLDAEQIVNYDYEPIDANGDMYKEYAFTNLAGEDETFSNNAYRGADVLISSLREHDLSDPQAFDQTTGQLQPWIIYNKNNDPGEGKLPTGTLQIRLPDSPESFQEAFGKKRPKILEVDYYGPYLIVKAFPWAVQEDNSWKLNVAKNLPVGDAIARARVMWGNHFAKSRQRIKDEKGWHDLTGVEDPNNIRMTQYRGRTRKLLDVLGNVGRRDIANEISGTACTGVIESRATGGEEYCSNPANHNRYPEEVAMITDKSGETTWKMVPREEAEARQEYINLQKGQDSLFTTDQLKNEIDRLQSRQSSDRYSPSTISAHGGLCDSCWLKEWKIIPEGLIKAMFDDLQRISRVSQVLMGQAKGDEQLAVAKKETLDLMDDWVNSYLAEGSFWETIIEYVEKSNLADRMKAQTIKSLVRFNENLEERVFNVYDPNLDLINATTPEPATGKPWFSRYVDLIMVQVNQLFMWAHAYRMHRYEHKDILGVRMDPERYIIPFSRIDRKDVRDRRALSRAMSSMGEVPAIIKWKPVMESMDVDKHDRVIIDGLLGEESYYNGLVGHIVNKQNGMCVVRLEPNDKLLVEHIKVYPGELSIIWEAPKELNVEEEHLKFTKETHSKERLKDDIISVIGDDVPESLYW